MTNLQLFEYSGVHPEPIIDPYYNRDKVVIPPTVEETNDLVEKNAKLIESRARVSSATLAYSR